jgi:hypothetical protein
MSVTTFGSVFIRDGLPHARFDGGEGVLDRLVSRNTLRDCAQGIAN